MTDDSNPRFIGKTTELLITSVTPEARRIEPRPASIALGDTHNGLTVGAILCNFMTKDGSYNGEQLLWRGRWSCKAGRNPHEVENAVDHESGEKRFDYIIISPVDLAP